MKLLITADHIPVTLVAAEVLDAMQRLYGGVRAYGGIRYHGQHLYFTNLKKARAEEILNTLKKITS